MWDAEGGGEFVLHVACAAEGLDIALCRASATMARAAEKAAGQQGQHLVLKMLVAVGPCSQPVLSEVSRFDRSVMVGIADDLEKAGHVRRERDPPDHRAYAITPAGRRILASGREEHTWLP